MEVEEVGVRRLRLTMVTELRKRHVVFFVDNGQRMVKMGK